MKSKKSISTDSISSVVSNLKSTYPCIESNRGVYLLLEFRKGGYHVTVPITRVASFDR
jgi:hypothetical protein